MAQVFVYNFTHATATGGVSISTGPLLLGAVIFNTPGLGANSFQLYNGTSTGGGLISSINVLGTSTNTAPFALTYDVTCPNGIFFNNTGGTSGDVTVVWA